MRECGLSFKESAEIRALALKEVGSSLIEQTELSRANLNVYHAKMAEEKKAATTAKRNATRAANKAAANATMSPSFNEEFVGEVSPRPPEKDSCITCGDITFSCSCDVKRTADIPF